MLFLLVLVCVRGMAAFHASSGVARGLGSLPDEQRCCIAQGSAAQIARHFSTSWTTRQHSCEARE